MQNESEIGYLGLQFNVRYDLTPQLIQLGLNPNPNNKISMILFRIEKTSGAMNSRLSIRRVADKYFKNKIEISGQSLSEYLDNSIRVGYHPNTEKEKIEATEISVIFFHEKLLEYRISNTKNTKYAPSKKPVPLPEVYIEKMQTFIANVDLLKLEHEENLLNIIYNSRGHSQANPSFEMVIAQSYKQLSLRETVDENLSIPNQVPTIHSLEMNLESSLTLENDGVFAFEYTDTNQLLDSPDDLDALILDFNKRKERESNTNPEIGENIVNKKLKTNEEEDESEELKKIICAQQDELEQLKEQNRELTNKVEGYESLDTVQTIVKSATILQTSIRGFFAPTQFQILRGEKMLTKLVDDLAAAIKIRNMNSASKISTFITELTEAVGKRDVNKIGAILSNIKAEANENTLSEPRELNSKP